MVRADDEPCHVRHDEADKAEQSNDGDGTCREDGRDGRQQEARELDAHAEALGHRIAELQHIEVARGEHGEREAHERVRPEHRHMRPATRREAADHPHERVVHAVAVEDHQSRDARSEEGGDSHASKDDADGLNAVLPGEQVDEHGRPHCADKGRRRDERAVLGEEQQDEDAHEPRARRDADDVRVGQRVLHDGLQDGAREREVDADERCHERARQPDIPEDLRVCAAISAHEDGDGLLRRDGDGAHHQADENA